MLGRLLKILGRTSHCYKDRKTQEDNVLRRPTYLHQLFVVQSSRCIQQWQTVSWPNQIFLLQLKPRNRMYLVDQLPCGSVLTPAISCTKFQIHSAHADSPMPKTDFFFLQFLERTSLYFTDQGTQKENELGGPTPPWVSTYTSHLLHKIPNPFYRSFSMSRNKKINRKPFNG